MVNGGTGILGAGTLSAASPEAARRTWPQWLGLGFALIAVAVTAILWDAAGARLVVGALGVFFAVRGAALFHTAGSLAGELSGRARTLGSTALVGGLAAVAVAVASQTLAARVLLVGVPAVLFLATAALFARGAGARRGGLALLAWSLLAWSLLVTGLLVGTGLAQSWARAQEVATVVTALGVAGLGVPLLVGAVNLRVVAARPAPARPVGCAGCACGASGGCGG
ncbi:MAG: conserved rane protein of unknown function [Blastococcus sp.]|nr:conserved rane protein of unknown function [Blastococcus sp.]